MPDTLESLAEQIRSLTSLVLAQARKPQPSRPAKRRSRKEGPFGKSQHETMEVFRGNGRNVQASADALGITRQSMAGRLTRLREKLKTTKATHFLEKLKPYRTPRKKLQALPTDLRGNIAI